MKISASIPSNLTHAVTSAQYAFLRHCIRMGGSRSIMRRRAVARHCCERGYGRIEGRRFIIHKAGRSLFTP